MKKKLVFLYISLLFLNSCGGGSSGSDDAPEALPEEAPIRVVEETFGVDGNLWKPVSDDHASGAGNLVILLTSRYTTQFDSCQVTLNDGTTAQLNCVNDQPWTHVPYSCFSNGGRQTWRANFRCSSVARVEAVCKTKDLEVVFTVAPEQVGNICTRYG